MFIRVIVSFESYNIMNDSNDPNELDVFEQPKETGEFYPVFPISNAVFFPKTVIPLHIFEPRYKKMIAEVKNFGNKKFALTGLVTSVNPIRSKPEELGVLVEILEEEELPDGRFSIVVLILERVKILDYFRPYDLFSDDYALGEIVSIPEEPIDSNSVEWIELRKNLFMEFKSHFERITKRTLNLTEESIAETFTPEESINTVCNITLLNYQEKQSLLYLNSIYERGKRILEIYRNFNQKQRNL